MTSNFDNKAEFTVNAAGTIRGGALISASAKSATTGKLLSAARFTNDRNVEDEDVLNVGYQISLTSST